MVHSSENMPEAMAAPSSARLIPVATALLLAAMILSACNTIGGFGKDVEAAGGELNETAEETEDAL